MSLFQSPPCSIRFWCKEYSEKDSQDVDWDVGDLLFSAVDEKGLPVEKVRNFLAAHWVNCPDCPAVRSEREKG